MKKLLLGVSLIAVMLTSVACSNTDKETEKEKEVVSEVTLKQKENTANELDFEALFPNEELRIYAEKMIGTKAPDFTLQNLKGEEIQLSKMKGQNVIVEIASTTCPSCIASYPDVKKFKDLSKDQVKVLTVFPNEKKENVDEFFKVNKYLKDEELIAGEGMNNLIYDYEVQYTPTFFFIDKKGFIQYLYVGGDVNEVVLSSMSDLAFKTKLTDTFNTTVELDVETTSDIKITETEKKTSDTK